MSGQVKAAGSPSILVDRCLLDDEVVIAQEGDFYGRWITADIVGPFKGGGGIRG